MRNHDQKTRDMARSVLPSTARKHAREARAFIHGRDRVRLRAELHDLRSLDDPDDFEGDLTFPVQRHIKTMVSDRRSADKVGSLIAWAERLVHRDPQLDAASPEDREVHLRTLLPPGLIGEHALTHLWWVLSDRRSHWPSRTGHAPAANPDVERVAEIITAGRHGDLNRRIREVSPHIVVEQVYVPARRVVDDDHPTGHVVPAHQVRVERRYEPRYLMGAHDIEAFVNHAPWYVREVVRSLHASLTA